MFIDKTGINRTEVRLQTVRKGSLLKNRRMAEVRLGQSLAGEQHQSMRSLEIRQQLEQPELDTLSCSEPSPVR